MTKAYTLNRLINEVSALTPSQTASYAALASALSPRAGTTSVKLFVLDSFLNGQLENVISGRRVRVAGKTARARILNALRARKNGNF